MKRHALLTILFVLFSLNGFSQDDNLRKIILKSDLIISTENYRLDTLFINDFTANHFMFIDKINAENTAVYKNNLTALPKSMKIRVYRDNEDYFSKLSAHIPPKVLRVGMKYFKLFFIKKNNQNFETIAVIKDLEGESLENYIHQIETI